MRANGRLVGLRQVNGRSFHTSENSGRRPPLLLLSEWTFWRSHNSVLSFCSCQIPSQMGLDLPKLLVLTQLWCRSLKPPRVQSVIEAARIPLFHTFAASTFSTVDMSFDWTVAPTIHTCILHGRLICLQVLDKSGDRCDPCFLRSLIHRFKVLPSRRRRVVRKLSTGWRIEVGESVLETAGRIWPLHGHAAASFLYPALLFAPF